MNDLWDEISKLPNKVERQIYFEYFNYGCPSADLVWLSNVTDLVPKYELKVLIPVTDRSENNAEMSH